MKRHYTLITNIFIGRPKKKKLRRISRRGLSGRNGRVERNLLGAREDFMRTRLLSPETQEVAVVKEVRDDVVHRVDASLPAERVAVKNVHRGSEPGDSVSQSVVLGRLPVADEGLVRRGLALLDRGHPLPHRSHEGDRGVLLEVLGVVQQIDLQRVSDRAVVVVPVPTKTMR